MKFNQVYSIINSAAAQAFGTTAVVATDLSGLISLGDTVLASNTNKDAFLNALADRIGKTVVRNLDLEVEFPEMLMDSFEFGAVLQKISIDPLQAKEANWANVGQAGFTPTIYDVDKVTVHQKLFTESNAWQYQVTIPDTMLQSAFTSAEAMGSFIEAILAAARDSLTLSINNMSHLAICNFVGEKAVNNNQVINLLALYNTASGSSLTPAQAVMSESFFRYAGKVIRDYIDYLNVPSALYNVDGRIRRTPRDNMHVLINSQFASGFDTYLTADTFNRDLAELPMYKSVVEWQGTGETPSFAESTKIEITTSSGRQTEVDYVIGILADRQAIITGYKDVFTAADRNNRERYTNYTFGHTEQYINDLSENGVIFTLADPVVVEE